MASKTVQRPQNKIAILQMESLQMAILQMAS